MTVKELIRSLTAQDAELPVIVRCQWPGQDAGEAPPDDEWDPYLVVGDMDPDTADDIVVIECKQEKD
jgi:hypothetical protein